MWQRLLGLEAPFDWMNITQDEVNYYRTKKNRFGIPMDPRHTYVKSDWLSWIAAMAYQVEGMDAFEEFFNPIFDELNATPDRYPFTDLYDTTNAHQSIPIAFIARPVVGGVFAHALLLQRSVQA